MPRGGFRENSGRKVGSGKFGAPTKAIRVPEHLVATIYEFIEGENHLLPFYGAKVKAGLPSPVDDYIEGKLNLHEYLIKHPNATFMVRASGNSMIGVGICDQALLIVDRNIEPTNGKVVIAVINGELTVKTFEKNAQGRFLVAANPDYPPIVLKDADDVHIWGVVIHVINSL